MASGRTKLLGLDRSIKPAAEWALDVADHYGIPVTVTSGVRSLQEQTRLRRNFEQCVATGRYPSPPDCLYPANRPGESAHNYGLAWDSVTSPEWMPAWVWIRQYAGFKVLPQDQPHAEYPGWEQFFR